MLLVLLLALSLPQSSPEPTFHALPLDALELRGGALLPVYDEWFWSPWAGGADRRPWAWLDGAGEARVVLAGEASELWPERAVSSTGAGWLVTRSAGAPITGTLATPRASGEGFLRLAFALPASAEEVPARRFLEAELAELRHWITREVPGSAWFRHRVGEIEAALDVEGSSLTAVGPRREPVDLMALFSGGQALAETLQLERDLPQGGGAAAAASVAVETVAGLTVPAFDWTSRLHDPAPALDPLASLLPADQYALFFPSFGALALLIDRGAALPLDGAGLEGRAVDSGVFERVPRQLALELDAVARALGPVAIDSVAVTGSEPYFRSGTDVAVLLRPRGPEARAAIEAVVAARQAATGLPESTGETAGLAWRARVAPDRSISSYAATLGDVVVVTNSPVQLERLARAAADPGSSLAALDELRFFRQRYPLRGGGEGAPGETAFVVLSDAAIRRWCGPRSRIGAARRWRARARLLELQARHADELVAGVAAERSIVADDAGDTDPELGALFLGPDGVRSQVQGTLRFQTPICERDVARVTEEEARLYGQWRDGYARNWTTRFDPIAARVDLGEGTVALDLTVMPLIAGTEYRDLREVTHGPGLRAGDGDPHESMAVGFTMALDPEWEAFRSAGSTLRQMASSLEVDPLSWLGGWITVFADDAPVWDEVLAYEDLDEALEQLVVEANELPVAFEVGVRSPLKLALFLTSMRTLVEGSAPGLTEWNERERDGQRFVEITGRDGSRELSIYYATLPEVLILSLHEDTLLAAARRWIARRGAAEPEGRPAGEHAVLELRRRGLDVLGALAEPQLHDRVRGAAFACLPILNEWRRRFPDHDPEEVHERVLGDRLATPGGGSFVWDADWHTMASTAFGHPGAPRHVPGLAVPWAGFTSARLALTFEPDGLRVRAALAE